MTIVIRVIKDIICEIFISNIILERICIPHTTNTNEATNHNQHRKYHGWKKYCLSVSKSIDLLLTKTNGKENAVYATPIKDLPALGMTKEQLVFGIFLMLIQHSTYIKFDIGRVILWVPFHWYGMVWFGVS